MERANRRAIYERVLLLGGMCLIFLGFDCAPASISAVAYAATPTSKIIVGYFVEWGVYNQQYFVKNVVSSGTASKINVINYAFGAVANNQCALGDPYADYQMPYDATNSVNGFADSSDPNALHGSFHQLQELKQLYPSIKVLISIGGGSGSGGFSSAAEPANLKSFVHSCISTFITDPRWRGVFDGIDIDWEYPAACGQTCGAPEDTRNYTRMLAEFRRQLNAVRHGLLLTIATPPAPEDYTKIQLKTVQRYINWMNLMTYDIHGTWESTTNHAAPLHYSSQDPTQSGLAVDTIIAAYRKAGVAAKKIVLGIPFYGYGWTGVPNVNNGLYQTSSGPANASGTEDYAVLKTYEATYGTFFDPVAQASWIYDPGSGTFWSYDTPTTVGLKGSFIMAQKLAGAMYWQMASDDANGTLVTALENSLR